MLWTETVNRLFCTGGNSSIRLCLSSFVSISLIVCISISGSSEWSKRVCDLKGPEPRQRIDRLDRSIAADGLPFGRSSRCDRWVGLGIRARRTGIEKMGPTRWAKWFNCNCSWRALVRLWKWIRRKLFKSNCCFGATCCNCWSAFEDGEKNINGEKRTRRVSSYCFKVIEDVLRGGNMFPIE